MASSTDVRELFERRASRGGPPAHPDDVYEVALARAEEGGTQRERPRSSVLALAAAVIALVVLGALVVSRFGNDPAEPVVPAATPPVDAPRIATGRLTYDGATCRYSGERFLDRGARIDVAVRNRATVPMTAAATRLSTRPDPDELGTDVAEGDVAASLDVDAVRRGTMSFEIPASGEWVGLSCSGPDGVAVPGTVLMSLDGVVSTTGTSCTYDGVATFTPGQTLVVGLDTTPPLRGLLVTTLADGVTLDDVRAAEFGSRYWNYDLGSFLTSQVGVEAGPVTFAAPDTGQSVGLACLLDHTYHGFAVIDPAD
ncbi:MAG TPA: hypothetical protein VGK49_06940 [Ilumatobacteraceae bacterium]